MSDKELDIVNVGTPGHRDHGKMLADKELLPCGLCIGGKYNWVNQSEKLMYIGKNGYWHQFSKVEYPEIVWCEVLDSDLKMIEETK